MIVVFGLDKGGNSRLFYSWVQQNVGKSLLADTTLKWNGHILT
ncbi:MAG: hypothetical protein ABI865_12990 [Nitrosospira sp.]